MRSMLVVVALAVLTVSCTAGDGAVDRDVTAPLFGTEATEATAMSPAGDEPLPSTADASGEVDVDGVGPDEVDAGLAPLAEDCFAGDLVACDDLLARSQPGSPEEEVARTCGGRIDRADSCASTFCPEQSFSQRTGLPPQARVVERFETESFSVLICEAGDALYYFAQAKAPPNASITLEADVAPSGDYIALNPGVTRDEDYVYSIGPRGLTVNRGPDLVLAQPLLEG